MTEPAPLTSNIDLRGYAFMPLDVARLRDSDLATTATGEEFRAAVLLWCASWHQVPAASLPTDDVLLAKLAGFGRDRKSWLTVKNGALHGFVLCSDGRLYHPVIAEKAIEAFERREAYRKRTAAATEARRKAKEARSGQSDDVHNGSGDEHRDDTLDDIEDDPIDDVPDDNRNVADRYERNDHQGTGTGTGTKKGKNLGSSPVGAKPDDEPEGFEEFWENYPIRAGTRDRKGAVKAFRAAVNRGAEQPKIIAGAKAYADYERCVGKFGTEYVRRATTWLNADGWNETYLAPPPVRSGHGNGVAQPEPLSHLRARLISARERKMWDRREWGPMPGEPGCRVPSELLLPTDGQGWTEWQVAV